MVEDELQFIIDNAEDEGVEFNDIVQNSEYGIMVIFPAIFKMEKIKRVKFINGRYYTTKTFDTFEEDF